MTKPPVTSVPNREDQPNRATRRGRPVDAQEAAAYIHTTEATLRQWRYLRRGPNWIKSGSRVLYRVEDLDAYLDANTVTAKVGS